MTKVTNSLSFQGEFKALETFNSSFLRTKCKVFAFGNNRNASNITEDAFNKAKKSLAFIPVVAKFSDNKDVYGSNGDLEGHNVELEKDSNGDWVLRHDTFPIGVVSPNANISFEEVNEGTELEPEYKTYVVVDEVFLWKRYDATKKIEEWLSNGVTPKVSMEINNIEGSFNNDNYFRVDSFEFEAIAALGSDIEPCFPFAQIEQYSLIDVKKEFEQMLNELKFTLQEGGKEMEENTVAAVVEEVLPTEDSVDEVIETVESDVVEQEFTTDETSEEAEEVVEEDTESVEVEEVAEEVEVIDYQSEFTQLQEKYEAMKLEMEELKTFKTSVLAEQRKVAEDELFESFSAELTEEDVKELKETASEFNLEQIEEKLYTLVGKKKASFSKQPKKEKQTSIKIEVEHQDEKPLPYGGIFEKYK